MINLDFHIIAYYEFCVRVHGVCRWGRPACVTIGGLCSRRYSRAWSPRYDTYSNEMEQVSFHIFFSFFRLFHSAASRSLLGFPWIQAISVDILLCSYTLTLYKDEKMGINHGFQVVCLVGRHRFKTGNKIKTAAAEKNGKKRVRRVQAPRWVKHQSVGWICTWVSSLYGIFYMLLCSVECIVAEDIWLEEAADVHGKVMSWEKNEIFGLPLFLFYSSCHVTLLAENCWFSVCKFNVKQC